MNWEAWLTLGVVGAMLLALAREFAPTEAVVWFSLAVLVLAGAITGSDKLPTAEDAVVDMGNSGLVTIGFLFIVVEGLIRTGATERLAEPLLKMRQTRFGLTLPLLAFVAAISAFLNNTAVVAMFLPIVHDLCKRSGIPPSRLFLPMCFAATLGGVCTLMGTSTNLVVDGLLKRADLPRVGLFELSWVGVPVTVAGIAYMAWAGKYLLPDRKPPISLTDDPREYSVEMQVDIGGPLVGLSVEEAGLRHLPGLFLVEIQRGDQIMAAVSAKERFQAADRLVFVGVVDSVVDLRRVRGLSPAIDTKFKLGDGTGRVLIEAVVSSKCPLVGQTIREGDFRGVYEAAVLAVARDGERLNQKIGDVQLQPGDTLLLEGDDDFLTRNRHSRDFFLVSGVENSHLPRRHKGTFALTVLMLLIGGVATERIDLLLGAIVAAFAMLLFRCCTVAEGRSAVDWSVLLVIGAAFGLAKALESSGAAQLASTWLVKLAGSNRLAVLAMIYLATLLATELITNNAAAALMFPIAMKTAQSLECSTIPFAVAIMVAASCGFATPFGYQTNLMVVGPGGYRFRDFLRFGIPLDIVVMIVAVTLIPLVWKL